ncbi:LysM peptidoglycan-binding domain-containing protein [Paenibacillus sp. YYML68]|uniref:LysM peptidoglycan-binding domain-containing protein n=1 Tax=Paenibacillus sp. YYML68 TaxID=2909250 RepID=UPI00249351DF|nr:LysM peptidoglycan-binding domain-containing protein [Paenibacillus sp. YYML68]
MATEQNGLRFDIYERVHLHEGVLGIQALEGVELVPHIQVISQGEQAVLRGNLLLSGTYTDEQQQEGQTLEHLIPVEITLPMSRVARVEDISVEIDNFDVDLLTSRSLNITGVLSLNGLELPANDEQSWEPDSRRQDSATPLETQPQRSESASDAAPARSDWQQWAQQSEQAQPAMRSAASEEEAPQDATAASSDAERVEPVSAAEPQAAPAAPAALEAVEQASEAAMNAEASAVPVPVQAEQPIAAVEEKKELKVAFGAKKPAVDAAPAAKAPGGIASLMSFSGAKSQGDQPAAQQQAVAAPATTAAERVEWKSMLLSTSDEQQQFRKLRMVIVQKDDTLESIAKKYNVNAREIVLYNRLGDNDIAVGQIVRIPR